MDEAVVKVTCGTHGELILRADQIVLTLFDNPVCEDYYSFHCPACGEWKKKPAQRAVVLLIRNVVQVRELHVPLELTEDRSGPPITESDVMDFVAELYRNESIRMPNE